MELKCIYYKTVKRNEYTGETYFRVQPTEVCSFSVDGIVKCHGIIMPYSYGMPLILVGEYINGSFQVTNIKMLSGSIENTKALLGNIPELTPFQQEAVTNCIGVDPFDFIKSDGAEKKIADVLKKNKDAKYIAKKIISKIEKIYEYEFLFKVLIQYGVSVDRIDAIARSGYTLDDIRKNPYMIFIFNEISIYTADNVARAFCNIQAYSDIRVRGYIYDAVNRYQESGNTCIDINRLLALINYRIKNSLFPENEMSISIVYTALQKMNLTVYEFNDNIYVYTSQAYKEETAVIGNLIRLCRNKETIIKNIDASDHDFPYTDEQLNALKMLHTAGVKVLTGPPGAGKTRTIEGIIKEYKKAFPKRKVRLGASTGKASQVMAQDCHMMAETVYRLLDLRPYEDSFHGKNERNPIDADIIIIDEVSMIGLQLFDKLLRAVKTGATLVLVGDPDQLDSVEYGNVLKDLIDCGYIEVYKLTKMVRQSGLIIENTYKIKEGNSELKTDDNFVYEQYSSPEDLLSNLQNIDICDSIVLSNVKKGDLGVKNINKIIQSKQKHGKLCLEYGEYKYYVGDPVIMNKTNYRKGYFNGNIGKIVKSEGDLLYIDFSGETIILEREDFIYMSPAYAITIHKSQGSEYKTVYIILPNEPRGMLTRRLILTAITRAKERVYVWCINDACSYAITNRAEQPRLSLLGQRLKVAVDNI